MLTTSFATESPPGHEVGSRAGRQANVFFRFFEVQSRIR